jgi:hypothetical protein
MARRCVLGNDKSRIACAAGDGAGQLRRESAQTRCFDRNTYKNARTTPYNNRLPGDLELRLIDLEGVQPEDEPRRLQRLPAEGARKDHLPGVSRDPS